MRILTILALAIAALLVEARGSQAAPWCAWYDPYTYNCGFFTWRQCMDTISGVGGYCARNVAAPVVIEEPLSRRVKRRYGG